MSDITRIDLNLLVVLDALLDERSVTRAAARLAQGRRTWLVDVSETGLTEEITQLLLEWAEER